MTHVWIGAKTYLLDYLGIALRPIYLYEKGKSPTTLQGCDKILESLATGTPTNAIRYLTKTGSCSKASFSRPQLAHAIRRIATQTE
jgi:hypothetical protein